MAKSVTLPQKLRLNNKISRQASLREQPDSLLSILPPRYTQRDIFGLDEKDETMKRV